MFSKVSRFLDGILMERLDIRVSSDSRFNFIYSNKFFLENVIKIQVKDVHIVLKVSPI